MALTKASDILGLEKAVQEIAVPIDSLSASKVTVDLPDFEAENASGALEELKVDIAGLSASVLTIGGKLENVTEASTTEKIVGKWVDDSDVYEKTMIIDPLVYDTAGTFLEIGIIENCDELIALNAILWNSTKTKARELPFISTDLVITDSKVSSLTFEKTADHGHANGIIFYSNDTWSSAKLVINARYTKTAPTSTKRTTKKK